MCPPEGDRNPLDPKRTGVILAGGESRRFGKDKALQEMGEKRLIEYALNPLSGIFKEVLIVANRPRLLQAFDVPVASDVIPGAGSLGGILTGLIHAKTEQCFVVACDMPFLNQFLIRLLVNCPDRYDVVVPMVNGLPEPLHARYSKKCIAPIIRLLFDKDYRIVDFYRSVPTLEVMECEWSRLDPEGLSFVNINTPTDFQKALERLQRTRMVETV